MTDHEPDEILDGLDFDPGADFLTAFTHGDCAHCGRQVAPDLTNPREPMAFVLIGPADWPAGKARPVSVGEAIEAGWKIAPLCLDCLTT
jgi:hypothetical protein